MTAIAFAFLVAAVCSAAVIYPLLFWNGLIRSRSNVMARSFLEPHSWRWWAWTILCRPSFFLVGYRRYVWLPIHGRPKLRASGRLYRPPLCYGLLRLPSRLFPEHMR